MNRIDAYRELEGRIGYEFDNKNYLIKALSHSSYVNELKLNKHDDYEREEFLGDAVLELVVSDFLFRNKSDMREGDMTKLRASLVCEPTLSFCGRTCFNIGEYILLGKGEDATGGRGRDSILSDVFEAIIGAIFLDGGFEAAKSFIYRFVLTDYESKIEFSDSKTILQEYAQSKGMALMYELVNESGPDHDKDYFVKVTLGNEYESTGVAKNKKAAEQRAAFELLKNLQKDGKN